MTRRRRLHAYVHDALDAIQRTALFSDAVNWDDVRGQACSVLTDASCYTDTHAFLATVLRQAGGRHSHLTTPQLPQQRELSPRFAAALGPPVPTGHLIETGPVPVGYLRLPRLSGSLARRRRYLAAGAGVLNVLMPTRPRGWIVDLRANIGGNMWPMLAVAAPLLPTTVLGHFQLPDASYQTWSQHGGWIRLDGKPMARSRGPRPDGDEHTPIAVLTSRHTASAGEAVALAFRAQPAACLIGTPTAGLTTGNHTHVLRDGTRLHISGSRYADHRRLPIDGPIPVDRHLTENTREAALAAAADWIHGRTPRL